MHTGRLLSTRAGALTIFLSEPVINRFGQGWLCRRSWGTWDGQDAWSPQDDDLAVGGLLVDGQADEVHPAGYGDAAFVAPAPCQSTFAVGL
jgi:hypothetical protein